MSYEYNVYSFNIFQLHNTVPSYQTFCAINRKRKQIQKSIEGLHVQGQVSTIDVAYMYTKTCISRPVCTHDTRHHACLYDVKRRCKQNTKATKTTKKKTVKPIHIYTTTHDLYRHTGGYGDSCTHVWSATSDVVSSTNQVAK